MVFFDWFKRIFTGYISDEEIAATEWVVCPMCGLSIEKDIVTEAVGEIFICPQCKNKIIKQ